MSKRIGVTLLVVALTVAIAYSVVAGVTFVKECPVKTTTPTEAHTESNDAEVIYNALMYTNGSYEYDLQVYVNEQKAVEGLSESAAKEKKKALASAVAAVKNKMVSSGAAVKKSETYFLNVKLSSYDSATDRALANGETGYDRYVSDTKTYYGLWYNWYVSESTTVFADDKSDNVINYAVNTLKSIGKLKSEEIDLVFNYGSKYSVNTIASDADVIYHYVNESEGVECYMHEFRMKDSDRTRKITLVQHSPNTLTWYLCAIVPILAVTGIILLAKGRKRS